MLDPKPLTWHMKNRAYLRDYLRDYRKRRKEATNRYSRAVLQKLFKPNRKEAADGPQG